MKGFSGRITLGRALRTIALSVTLVSLARSAEMPFDPKRGLVEFTAAVNGVAKGKFGLDTGADRLYLDREFAQRAGLKVTENPHTVVNGINGSSSVGSVALRSFSIGDEILYNVNADVIDMSALTGGQDAPDGLVGYEALRRFYITLNYPARTVDLFTHEPSFLLDESTYEPVSFRLSGHLIMVDAFLDGKSSVPMFLDFCAGSSVLDPLAASASLGQDKSPAWTKHQVQVGAISANDVAFYHKPVENFRPAGMNEKAVGILGYTFLRQFCITIDYNRSKIYFHRL